MIKFTFTWSCGHQEVREYSTIAEGQWYAIQEGALYEFKEGDAETAS